MGDAKRRKEQMASTGPIGTDHINNAYEVIYGMVKSVYLQTGGVNHQLIGIDFNGAKVDGVNVLEVDQKEKIPHLVSGMLKKWPLVVHVVEIWTSRQTDKPASEASDRQDAVGITLHTEDSAFVATCLVDVSTKIVSPSELRPVQRMDGLLGREFPTRH